jgi:transcriptional regulator of aromatic amino acid metabolism
VGAQAPTIFRRNVMDVLAQIWALLNTPAGITFVASLIVIVLNKVYAKHPAVRKYEGYLIAGIKYAEKIIPDDTENKSLAKLDKALEHAVTLIEAKHKIELSRKAKAALAAEIPAVHHRIDNPEL